MTCRGELAYGDLLRAALWTHCRDWASVTVSTDGGVTAAGHANHETAASADLRLAHVKAMGETMSRLYASTAAMLLGRKIDFVLTLEDDVEIVTEAPLAKLLGAMTPRTMAVAAVVRSRFRTGRNGLPALIAYEVDSEQPYHHRELNDDPGKTEPERIGASHFACTLHRAEAWQTMMARRASVNGDGLFLWHDIAHSANVRRAGYEWVLHWGVRTRHWGDDGRGWV